MKLIAYTLLKLLMVFGNIESAKILVILPYAGKSHNIFIRTVTEMIASRGHEVHYYTCLPSENKVENIKEIQLNNTLHEFMSTFDHHLMRKNAWRPIFSFPSFLLLGVNIAERSLDDPVLAELILSNERYDLVMLETHFGQEAFIAFGHKFKAPVISISPSNTFYGIDEYFGNPFGTAYLPTMELSYNNKMNFIERVHNTIRTIIFMVSNYLYYLPKQDSLMRKHFNYSGSEDIPPIIEMLQNISLSLVNSQFSVDYARPRVPNVVGIGGVHIPSERKPLPHDLKEFMDNSKDGVIYVSFGSIVRSEEIPADMKNAFINAFRKLKQNVLWKLPVESFPGLPKNVKLLKWLPQHDILAHPNCLAFITHGGLLSQEEAIYFGVPLIGVPIFGDQYLNVRRATDRGFAIYLDQFNITKESVFWAVNEIVYTLSYRENAKKYSDIFQDNPLPPREKAAYWIEYILRYKGAPHLKSEGRKLPYYKYLLLDVIAFMIIILALFIFIIYKIIKVIISLFSRKHKQTNIIDKKTN